MLGTLFRSVQADSSTIRCSTSLLTAIVLPITLGAFSLIAKTAPAQAEPVVIELGRYGTPIYVNGNQVYSQPAPASISTDTGAVRAIPLNPSYPSYGGYPSYPQNYGVKHFGYSNRSINNSVLVNPTVIHSSIRNSTLINPTIVGVPGYHYPITTYSVHTYTRPDPEVVVDPKYGVRYKRPSEY